MSQNKRLKDFMSSGARAFLAQDGVRSAALTAVMAVGMTFSSSAEARVVEIPVPTLRQDVVDPAPLSIAEIIRSTMEDEIDDFVTGSIEPARQAIDQLAMMPLTMKDRVQAAVLDMISGSACAPPGPEMSELEKRLACGNIPERAAAAGFGPVSLKLMENIHPDMQELLVTAREMSDIPFEVVPTYGGKRTPGMQALLKRRGVTKTLKSKHLLGLAFDVAPKMSGGRLSFTDEKSLEKLSETMMAAGEELGIRGDLTWGGEWKFKDMFHFELPADWNQIREDRLKDPDPSLVASAELRQ